MAMGIGEGVNAAQADFQKTQTTRGTSKQKILTKEGFDKIVYDILSSDQGLAALASGENASGGFGSSTKTLMAQDMITKLAGELANITAPEVEQEAAVKKNNAQSVICTELVRQGKMDFALYEAGHPEFRKLPMETIFGYHSWAVPLVPFLSRHAWASRIAAWIVHKRYAYVLFGQFSIIGYFTINPGHAICHWIGSRKLNKYLLSGE